MEGYFSIAQIASKVRRSKQAIYKLISNNQELGKILPDNTITVGKGKQYSKAVLDWITEYYERIADSEGDSQEQEEAQASADQVEMALLRQQVEHLQEKLAMTEKQLEESKTERAQLHQDYSAVLLLFAQEKAEKQQLLIEVQEQKKIAIQEAQVKAQEAQIEEADEKSTEEEKAQKENKKPGFFARLFSKGKKGSADK